MSVISSDSRRALKTLAVVGGRQQVQHEALRLTRSLGSLETWGFGMSGLLLWLSTAPSMHAALGPQAIFVWLPSAIVGMLFNLQVKRLGTQWPEVSGGTPNYTTRLLRKYPGLGRLAAIGYFIGWSSVPVINAIILTDLIKANLGSLGIACPETVLRIGFTVIPFILAFSGTRAIAILHLCFVIPAMGFLLIFCFQGLGWLAISPASPGLVPPSWSSFSFPEWAKWYFIAVYAIYDCETVSSFVAESKRPAIALQCLNFAAWLIPPVYIGGSWLLMRLATEPSMGDNAFLNLLAAAKPFWGQSASWLVTLLIFSSCLLSSTTAVSNCPRILYQLALDRNLAPVFAVVSRRGVLEPALTFNLLIGLAYLVWGDSGRIVMVTGTGYLLFSILFHLGLWLSRGRSEVRWPWWSLGFFLLEVVVLVVGGLAWSWQDLVIGLLFPVAILAVDAAIRRISFGPFHPKWWLQRYYARADGKSQDFVMFQVIVLIILICCTATISWVISAKLNTTSGEGSANLLVIVLVTLSFVGVAIASWTTLPQVASIDKAREQAENLFITALDAILLLDENGVILQTNPAAEELFQINSQDLVGQRLNKLLSTLTGTPDQWANRTEQTLLQNHQSLRMLELSISQRSNGKLQEYTVILRDITERKQAEETLQLFAGIASSRARDFQELEPVFNKAVQAAREMLNADRVVVYRFKPNWSGYIAAESVVAD